MGGVVAGGPGKAKEELAELLRQALADKKWRQADLARETGLSKAAVSQALNGKNRSVPSVYTLEQMTRELGITGASEQRLQRLRSQAEPRASRLDGYLAAAGCAGVDQPYPGVLPAGGLVTAMPPLAAVYRSQQANRLGEDVPLPAEGVLAQEQTCVVLAGPGGGKSSLLRTRLSSGIRSWAEDGGADSVPVLVRAAALTELPLAEALAAAVTTDLKAHAPVVFEDLPPEFFAAPVHPGVCWQVLVDGLDEVPSPAARASVLRKLAAADRESAGLYRFVVATRPLPGGELDALGSEVPHYELQSFTAYDVRDVIASWFRYLGVADPDQAIPQFAQELDRSGLASLARIPLMASMLCQIRAAAPGQPLPEGRTGVYDRFIQLIYRQNTHKGIWELQQRAASSLEQLFQHPPERALVTSAATSVRASLPLLIQYLAHERLTGNTAPAVDVLAAHQDAARPGCVEQYSWDRFLGDLMRSSGLLDEQAGDFAFLHQTYVEYLAACHAEQTGSLSRALRDATGHVDRYSTSRREPEITLAKPRIRWRRYWSPPPEDAASYVGFLIDLAHRHPLPRRDRGRLLAKPHLNRTVAGAGFIVRLEELGTRLPDDVRQAAAKTMRALTRDASVEGGDRVLEAVGLAVLGDACAAAELSALAHDIRLDGYHRIVAAVQLAHVSEWRAVEALDDLACDPHLDPLLRMVAARRRMQLGGPRG